MFDRNLTVIQQRAIAAKIGGKKEYEELEQLFIGRFKDIHRKLKYDVPDYEVVEKHCKAILKRTLKEFNEKIDFLNLFLDIVDNFNWQTLSYAEFSVIYDDQNKTLDEVVQQLKTIPENIESQVVKKKSMTKQPIEEPLRPKKEKGGNKGSLLNKNISEEQCMMLEYCALPFEERLSKLRIIVKKIPEKEVIKVLKKLKKQGFITYGVGWNAERKAVLTPKGRNLLKQFHKTN